ncbi:MAG: enoyl-CoA hydratase-related protein [Tenuifilaceae bacterium]|nr:enoyl-CoA hydratase-related protein [Tenuifilaceae bacterium]
MDSYNEICIDTKDGVTTIWLNKPDLHNAVSIQMLEELTDCFHSIEQMDNVRVIVLRGKGKSFSAGANLVNMLTVSKSGYEQNLADGYKWTSCLSSIASSSKPTIAIATGNVFGGGNGLLAAADMVIADENAIFSFSEVKLGLAPSTILPYVLTRVNQQKAKYLMLTGKIFSAAEGYDYGLVDFLIPSEKIEALLNSIIADLRKASPSGIKEIKRLIRELGHCSNIDEVNNLTANSIATLKTSTEAQEGISAFIEKRKPYWLVENENE